VSASHSGQDLPDTGCDCTGRRGEPWKVLEQDREWGGLQKLQQWGSFLLGSLTHPAAPATPSPRRRETSFSLPRLSDSRILEQALLRRRVWGGRPGHQSVPPFSSSPRPRSRSEAHPPSSPVLRHQLCLCWGLLGTEGTVQWGHGAVTWGARAGPGAHPEGQAGPRGSGSLGTALLLAGTCSVSGRPRPAGRVGDRGSALERPRRIFPSPPPRDLGQVTGSCSTLG